MNRCAAAGLIATFAVAAVTTACTTQVDSPTALPESVPDDAGAAEIDDARDLATAADDICALFPADQLDALSPGLVATPDVRPAPWGQTPCMWRNDEMSFGLTPDTRTGATVADTARLPEMEPVDLPSAHPAFERFASDRTCAVTVHAAQREAVLVNYFVGGSDLPEHRQPCQMAARIADLAIQNLPPKS